MHAVTMAELRPWGVVVESPALVIFGWGKLVGWVLGAMVVLTRQLVEARGSCAAGRRGHPLPGFGLPPPVSVSREEKEEEGAQGAWGKGRGPALVPHSRPAAGAWSCCPAVRLEAEEMAFR